MDTPGRCWAGAKNQAKEGLKRPILPRASGNRAIFCFCIVFYQKEFIIFTRKVILNTLRISRVIC